MANNIGAEIAAAKTALDPQQAAEVIYHSLFERGPNRMSAENKFTAMAAMIGGLVEWKRQLLSGQGDEVSKWRRKYEDTKKELDNVKVRLAILLKER